MMPSALPWPRDRTALGALQSERKRVAVEQAKRSRFFAGQLDAVRLDALDDDLDLVEVLVE